MQPLRSYLSLTCEYELYILPNKKVSTAKDLGKNYNFKPTVTFVYSIIEVKSHLVAKLSPLLDNGGNSFHNESTFGQNVFDINQFQDL